MLIIPVTLVKKYYKMKSPELVKPLVVSLGLFAVAAIFGLSMRLAFVIELPEWIDYRKIQHAHSHVALLGWLFGAFFVTIIGVFKLDFNKYRRLYWLLQGTVVAMALAFPMVGYAPITIGLTTLHIILSYVFVVILWRDLIPRGANDWPVILLRSSLVFLVVSTLGTWALGPITALGDRGSALYYGAIQFYLHFQFNGWLIFVALAILLEYLQVRGVSFDPAGLRRSYLILLCSVPLTFALAVTWSTPLPAIFAVNSLGVIVQLAALIAVFRLVKGRSREISIVFSRVTRTVLLVAVSALVLKVLVQTAVVIPPVAEISYTIRNFVVGFIHLLMLGCLSLILFTVIAEISGRRMSIPAIWLFLFGVVTTEVLLFVQGIFFWARMGFIPFYYQGLAICSAALVAGILTYLIHFSVVKEKKS